VNILNLLLCLLLLLGIPLHAQTDSLYLWINKVPNEKKPKSEPIPVTLEDGSIRVVEVTNPFLAVFEPEPQNKNGKAIIVCPGGGYVRLAVHKEGYVVANWLNQLGYTVFVLLYRVPNNRDGALQDFQRSIKLVRHNAQKYGIDPLKIGALGFSAGAHLVTRSGLIELEQTYPKQDPSDVQSGKPTCMILIYPSYLDEGPNHSLSPGFNAKATTAGTFIFQTMDDSGAASSFALATAFQRVKANVELHMLPAGGHGYGMTPGNKAAEAWPKLLSVWLTDHL
jgi:acetyl esterase/lipase